MTAQEIADTLETPGSSIYRNLRELVQEGFLEASVNSRYRLGPAFIDFDRRMRINDPLIRVGSKFLPQLVEQSRIPSHAILSRIYNDQVICVAGAHSAQADFKTSYERGKPMPLTQGATSKAILARLPPRKLRQLLGDEIAPEVADELAAIRKLGYCITRGEVDGNLMGLAATVYNKDLGIHASLSLIIAQSDYGEDLEAQVLPILLSTAKIIGDRLQADADLAARST